MTSLIILAIGAGIIAAIIGAVTVWDKMKRSSPAGPEAAEIFERLLGAKIPPTSQLVVAELSPERPFQYAGRERSDVHLGVLLFLARFAQLALKERGNKKKDWGAISIVDDVFGAGSYLLERYGPAQVNAATLLDACGLEVLTKEPTGKPTRRRVFVLTHAHLTSWLEQAPWHKFDAWLPILVDDASTKSVRMIRL